MSGEVKKEKNRRKGWKIRAGADSSGHREGKARA